MNSLAASIVTEATDDAPAEEQSTKDANFMHYNFARVHKTLGMTPAMAAGISDHVWSLEEIAALLA